VNNDDDDDETVVARRNSMLMVGVYLLRIQILVVGGYPAPTQWVCRLGGPGAARNIDSVERLLPDLDAKTVRLHGRVDQARCEICNWVCDYKPHLFQGSDSLYCQRCLQRSQARILKGKRSWNIGRLRPNVLLYGEPHPDDKVLM
jgi:hypothetical protein